MPPLPPVPNTLKAVIHWTIGSDVTGQTVTHWGYSGSAPNAAACAALATSFRTACTAWDDQCPTSNSMTSFVITDLASTLGSTGENVTPVACTRAGTALPANAAVTVDFIVANRYRGGKGKAFIPAGVDADLLTNQQWGTAFLGTMHTAAVGWANAFIGSSSGGTTITDQRIVSYFAGYNPPTTLPSGRVKQTPKLRTSPTYYIVEAYQPQPKIGSQRRRLSR